MPLCRRRSNRRWATRPARRSPLGRLLQWRHRRTRPIGPCGANWACPAGCPPLLVPHPHDDAGNDDAGDKPFPARAMRAPADPEPVASPLTRLVAFEPAEPVAPAREPTPPPLVPTATRFVPPPVFTSAPPARSARTASPHRHSAPAATEVHVSIGRIELTAVHEAPPPARRPAPAKPSLPLHEYLARRQRRPS